MYTQMHFANNSYLPYEKKTNPHNMAIRPSDIDKLTAEGRSVAVHQLDGALFYPNIGRGVMPMEFQRGVDLNDCWEESVKAQKKVKDFVSAKKAEASNNPQTE